MGGKSGCGLDVEDFVHWRRRVVDVGLVIGRDEACDETSIEQVECWEEFVREEEVQSEEQGFGVLRSGSRERCEWISSW